MSKYIEIAFYIFLLAIITKPKIKKAMPRSITKSNSNLIKNSLNSISFFIKDLVSKS